MFLSSTLTAYIGRQFLLWVIAIFLAMTAVILLVDTVELLRRASSKPDATFGIVLGMSLLKLPHLIEQALGFAVLFGGMICFVRLTRYHELVVVRAAGVSVWQFLLPAVAAAFAIGIVKVAIFNPISAVLLTEYEIQANQYIRGRPSLLTVSSTGLWLRQADEAGDHAVIHAASVNPDDFSLRDVVIFQYRGDDQFVGRIDAATAHLRDGHWLLQDAWLTGPTKPGEKVSSINVPTKLTMKQIQDSFASPETITFWQLPRFIEVLDATGLSSVPHRLHWHALLADPFLLAAMVLIAATFSLRLTRRGGTVLLIFSGALSAFALYMLTSLIQALGLGGNLPVVLAAWTPAGVTSALGLAMLMHLEDG